MANYLKKLVKDGFLLREEVSQFIGDFIDQKVSEIESAGVLSVLSSKGENAYEILGVIDALYKMCQTDYVADKAVDTCGTGGSGLPKLNVSSAVALLSCCCGLKVAKHGNRSVTSKAGSADVFFAIGWPERADIEKIIECYQKTGFAFLYAPIFYPAMKAFAHLRRELRIRTIFNLAGPIANPFRVDYQLVGVSDLRLLDIYAEILSELGRKALIVYSDSGMDEIDAFCLTRAILVSKNEKRSFIINPAELIAGIKLKEDALFSKSKEYSISVFKDFLEGEVIEEFLVVVCLNTAYILWMLEKVRSPKEGFEMAMDVFKSGMVRDKWSSVLNVIGG